jgi:ketosteroid isomerase-like protein
MRNTIVLLALGCAGAAFAGTADELQQIEEQRREAIRAKDFATLARIYAPGFVAVAGNGQFVDRDRLFAVFAQTDPAIVFTTDEVRVVERGDSAVFFGRLVARRADGTLVSAGRFSHVFVRDGRGWVCIAGQSTPLANP